MLDVLKEVGIDFLIGCIVLPLYLLYADWIWKGINKWEWSKKIARMENKIIPALFLILVYISPFIFVFLLALLIYNS